MSDTTPECVFLVADNAMEEAFRTFLGDSGGFHKLEARLFTYRIINVPGENDSDLCFEPARVLEEQGVVPDDTTKLVVAFDQKYNRVPPVAESRATSAAHLEDAGWPAEHFHITVISPELEVWMWHDDDATMEKVEGAFHYNRSIRGEALRDRLASQNKWPLGLPKPPQPKATFEWTSSKYRSVAIRVIVRDIVTSVGVSRCQDAAFKDLKAVLGRWFPPAWLQYT